MNIDDLAIELARLRDHVTSLEVRIEMLENPEAAEYAEALAAQTAKQSKYRDVYRAEKGDEFWMVIDQNSSVLYCEGCEFNEKMARRVAALYNSDNPPADWEDARRRLVKQGMTHLDN